MPIAAVNEYDRTSRREYKVGPPRQAVDVKPETKAQCMQGSTDGEFRASVLATNPRHESAAGFGGQDVSTVGVSVEQGVFCRDV